MKKLFFIAAIASVALASCVKNEVAPTAMQQDEITFAAPVVTPSTKASVYYEGTTYPDTKTFNVYGYYHVGAFNGSSSTDLTTYMNDVTVAFDNSLGTDGDAGTGAWKADGYYWPKTKNSRLTFDAYAPSTLDMQSDANNGLTLASATAPYVIDKDVANQVDILYSTRAYDKTSSVGSTVNTYDGVDIVFNHALSVVQVKVASANAAANNNVKITKISVKNVSNKGFFNQNYTNGKKVSTDPAWTLTSGSTDEYVFSSTEALLTSETLAQYGDYHILLPQQFVAGGVTFVVNYAIKYNDNGTEKWLPQVTEFPLYNDGNYYTETGKSDKVEAWQMGYRYTYNFTIGLDLVYFAPEVTGWKEINVTIPAI